MKLEAHVGDASHTIEIDESGGRFRLEIGDRTIEGDVLRPEPGVYTFFVGSRVGEARAGAVAGSEATRVQIGDRSVDVRIVDRKRRAAGGDAGVEGRQTLTAPMPGKVAAILVDVGGAVERGQGVLVVEAMKMQNEVKAAKAGVVAVVRVSIGETVNAGQVLAVVD
jgi:biotin carboxyl carrier protein